MTCHDPVPWLMRQNGREALRARRLLDIYRQDDADAARAWCDDLVMSQQEDGSWSHSLLATAGTVKLIRELHVPAAQHAQRCGCEYLISRLSEQPGAQSSVHYLPGSLTQSCDLGGFFGPYKARRDPERVRDGAAEMNHYRKFEPLRGPQSPVRDTPRSSRDRPGPSSCYSWGLIPLCYTLETLALAGLGHDLRLRKAWQVLLAAQRQSGGWCRNMAGHPSCSLHALGAISAHPSLYNGTTAARLVAFMATSRTRTPSWWRGTHLFAVLEVLARLDLPEAVSLAHDLLADVAPKQHRDGSFSGSHAITKAVAVIAGLEMPQERERMCYL